MANDKKFVVKNGLTTQNIAFVDDITNANNTIDVSMLDSGTLSFSGNSGQLFSITDSLSGTIFSVNDISGVPSIEVDDDGTIRFAEFAGNVLIGTATDNGTDLLQVDGSVLATTFSGALSGNATTASSLQTARTISLGGVLSGSASFDGSSNITITAAHTSDPVITLTGAVTGSGTMTNLGNVSITTTATADPTLTLAGDVTGTATFTNLGNATLTATIADDSHNHIISNIDGLQGELDAKVDLAGDTMTGFLTLHADPTNAFHAATKEYVDTIASASLHYHTPVRTESPVNLNATYNNGSSGVGATLTNAGTQTALIIDGVAMSLNDRVLLYQQTDAAQNGVYVVSDTGSTSTNWVLTRSTDTDSYSPSDPDALGTGDAFFVREGDTGAGELYVMNTEGAITFGTTNITFVQISSAQIYSGDSGIQVVGTTISHADTSTQTSLTALTGASVVSDIDLDGFGHVTNLSTRSIALSDLGYTGATNADNYGGWDLLTDGTNRGQISSGENVNFVGGTNVSLSYSATNNTITINSTDTNTNQLTTFTLSADSGVNQTIAHNNTLNIAGGTYVSTVVGSSDTVTVNHDNTIRVDSTNSTSPGYGGTFTAIDSITTNATGHVTEVNTKTVTIPASDNTDTNTTYSISAVDSESNAIIRLTAGGSGSGTDDITLVAGSNVTLTPSGDNITIAATDTNTTYGAGNGISISGTTFSVAGGTGLTQDTNGLSVSDNGIGATQLNVSGNGTAGQALLSDGDGSFSWGEAGSSVTVSATAPSSPSEGELWWDEDVGNMFIYYNDGTSSQWVEASPNPNPLIYNAGTSTYTLSGNQVVTGTLDVNGQATAGSLNVQDLTSGRVVLAGTNGEIEDSANLTFNGTTLAVTGNQTVSGIFDVNSQATIASLNVEDLTSNRIVLAGTSGELEDDADFRFDGSTFDIGPAGSETFEVDVASGNTNIAGNLTVAGDINSNSDERLKENINTFEGGLNTINNMRGVRYDWKRNGKSSIGLIAQEVEEILPELVSEKDDIKSVQYGNIVAVLIEAVKELSAKVEELENK